MPQNSVSLVLERPVFNCDGHGRCPKEVEMWKIGDKDEDKRSEPIMVGGVMIGSVLQTVTII